MARKKSLDDNILTDSTYLILISLVEPLHGYAIMQKVKEVSNGEIEIGPASLYTILKKLQTAELIMLIEQDDSRKKIYGLTEKGKEILITDIDRRKKMVVLGDEIIEKIRRR
jgi:DNA-binding PadR family transcriptional regulator